MPGGRPAKPRALKILEGNPGKRALPKNEPLPDEATGEIPAWLKGRGRRAWKWLAPMLTRLKLLTEADEDALALLADAYAEYIECRAVVRKEGRTYELETKFGSMIRPRPEVGMAADAWRRVHRMLTEFGLTPSSRSRIQIPAEAPEDEFTAFLRGAQPNA